MTIQDSTSHRASDPADPVSLYAAWRENHTDPQPAELDALCALHPDLDRKLRDLHARYAYVDQLLGASLLGDEEIEDDEPLAKDAFEEVIGRLSKRRPDESRYEERHEIGRGGMGSILELYDVDLRRPLAKKVVRSDVASAPASDHDARVVGRFLEEAQITAQLAHPGVVPVHELGIDDEGRVYFTMDLVRGRTLQEVFALARHEVHDWNLTRAVSVLERVCETLAYAHSRGVIHRDIKPGNVMVGEFGEVYVMDWGLARILDELPGRQDEFEDDEAPTAVSTDRRDASSRDTFAGLKTVQGTAAGTPGYMAPEQARGEIDRLDARTDVFALGALLYTLLTGVRPYESEIEGDRMLAMFEAMRVGAYRPVHDMAPHAPAELVSIAHRAMSPDQEDRYPSGVALAADLRAWLEGRVVSAHEGGRWAELRKWVLRNRGLSAAMAATVLAVTGGAVATAITERNGRQGIEHQRDIAAVQDAPTRLAGLLSQSDELWPATPENAGGMRQWLADVDALHAGAPLIAEARAALAGAPSRFDAGDFDESLARRLKHMAERSDELIHESNRMRDRLALADSVEEISVSGQDARSAWEQASRSIAESNAYGGLNLAPQLGLLPLRQDPRSGLWEFWHVLSGDRPVLDPETDAWRMQPETGLVLVLIPGGHAKLGTPILPEDHELYDWVVEAYDVNVSGNALTHEVDLDPYFLSKYETTQAQWVRVMRENPSYVKGLGSTHPVETVSWFAAMEAARRFGLTLPTEAQWEWAARGGTRTRFFTGQDELTLAGHAVLMPDVEPLDGFADRDESGELRQYFYADWANRHLPVGSVKPNPYGLYDILGNVWEWARDDYCVEVAPRAGDGLRVSTEENPRQRVMRGGSYAAAWTNARVVMRKPWEKQNTETDMGFRPLRAVTL